MNPDHRTSILVIEDEPVTREILIRYLELMGFVTRSCSTGEDALSVLRIAGTHIDWLITDIHLPGCIDGWVVGAEFHYKFPLRPVIYASAFAPNLRSNMAGGVYVPKPYSPADIVAIIQQLEVADQTRDCGTPARHREALLRRQGGSDHPQVA